MRELLLPLAVVSAYVALLVGVAAWGERQEGRGRAVVSNRTVYALSLAVYASSWTFYGSVGFAARNGLLFLTVYLGPTICAAAWWWIVRGLVRLKERHRVSGLADLLALRYARSQRVAFLATAVVTAGIVPYLALQLKTMIGTLALVSFGNGAAGDPAVGARLGPPLVALMLVFTVAFGLRRVRPTERHPGLVLALAVESVVKLVAFLAVGVFVTWGLFDGPGDLFARAAAAPPTPDLLGGHGVLTWLSHLFLSACAVLLLPRQFHTTVVECSDEDHVRTASWAFPAYLLAINLFVLPVALGGLLLGHPIDHADTFVLRLPLEQGRVLLSWLVFLGGFSAAIGMVVVETTALATMISNHVVLPLAERVPIAGALRRRLLPVRWGAAALVLTAALAYERLFGDFSLSSIGFISFAAVLQLAPPLVGGLLWRGASRAGAVAGLVTGFLAWVYTLVVPVVARSGWISATLLVDGPFGIEALVPEGLFDVHLDPVSHAVVWTLLLNCGAFLAGSLLSPPAREELDRTARLLDGLAPPGGAEAAEGAPAAVAMAVAKRDHAAALLALYHGAAAGGELADACLARVTSDPRGALSPVQLAQLQAEVETTLAAAIGNAAAHAALRRAPLVTGAEEREVARAYAEILASLNVSPAELQRKIDYHRARERLLARDVANQRFLAGVSGLLGASLDLEATARTAVRLPVPLLADAALLWLEAWDGSPARAWVAHVDAATEARCAAALERLAPALGGVAPIARALGAADRLDRGPLQEWPGALGDALPRGRAVTLPLVAARGPLGTLSLFVDGDARLGPDGDLGLAEELARRLALAIENARLYLQAAQAIRLRDEFLAVASHELKTPLTPLRLKIQALERLVARGDLSRVPPDKLRQLFGGAEGQVVRLVALVDDLLDVTRLTTRRLRLRPEPVDLRAVVREVVERHAAEAAEARCEVAIREGPPVDGAWDRLRLEQVLTNLLTNAFKYAPGTLVEVGVDGDAGHARVEVRDEGPGIAPADQERIFRPFERAVRLLEVSGFGLGLFIVRQIVEAHGGTIALESTVGRGSTFRIELPRLAAGAA